MIVKKKIHHTEPLQGEKQHTPTIRIIHPSWKKTKMTNNNNLEKIEPPNLIIICQINGRQPIRIPSGIPKPVQAKTNNLTPEHPLMELPNERTNMNA